MIHTMDLFTTARLTGFALILCLSVSCKGKKETGKPKVDAPVQVDVWVAQTQPLSDEVTANGTVIANEYLEIHPEVSGRLTYLNLNEGAAVGKGAILAKINDADLRAQVGKIRTQLALARKTVERYKVLIDAGGINQSDYDLAVNQVNTYNADIAYNMALIDKTVIRAPFSGIVGLRQVSPGAYVTPQTTLTTLQQIAEVKIDFTLPQEYNDLVKKGDIVDVILDANSGEKGRAQILAIEPGANTDTRNLKVRAKLMGDHPVPGAFATVQLRSTNPRQAFMVPADAVIPDDQNNSLIVVKNGKAVFVQVQLGLRQRSLVEVTNGVNFGDSVVVTGVLFARPNSKVKVRSVKSLQQIAVADSTVD